MNSDKVVSCPVDVARGVPRLGVFANAFRVVPDSGDECFLDFCVYSPQENRAELVSRIRVHRSFLPVLFSRLQREVLERGQSQDVLFLFNASPGES